MTTATQMPGYLEATFSAAGDERRIFRSEQKGRGIILLHELPGLTAETKELADWIVSNGFHVVMPLLFGVPMQSPAMGMVLAPAVCIRREFNCFVAGRSSPITDWLRALCRHVHAECGGPGIGVIGMCFTGGYILSLMADASVIAPVTAQPSLPFLRTNGLDVDAQTLRAAAARADSAPLLGLRFREDKYCRQSRFDAINEAFCGNAKATCARFRQIIVEGEGHATLTFDYGKAARSVDTRQRVLEHLRAQLS